MKKGNTTKIDTPGGIGLKLLRDFAREHHGEVWIASGRAFGRWSPGLRRSPNSMTPFPAPWSRSKIPTEPTPGACLPNFPIYQHHPLPVASEPFRIAITDLIGKPRAIAAADGEMVFKELKPLIEAGTPVVLSFAGIRMWSSPRSRNAAIGKLYRDIPEAEIERLRR
ncbi:MAG: STAS-like domain-containing protein [Verrucomicrobiales bacterium]